MQTLKDISLTVNLSRIELIEQCHEDKGIKDYGEVFRWSVLSLD